MEFNHFDDKGNAVMVDISEKSDTVRGAAASGCIYMTKECYDKVKNHEIGKGDVISTARIAGIMGTKKTSELIPLCHIINITRAEIDFEFNDESCSVTVICKARSVGKTGVEMEALTGVSTALLTIYDMCKAVDKSMEIGEIHLLEKSGGKNGSWSRNDR